MTLLSSLKIPLETTMPEFKLCDPKGNNYQGTKLFGEKGLLIVFTCNHCPYANAIWPRVINIAAESKALGINTIAINPNIHPEYPDDAPEKMIEKIEELKIEFPYLVDKAQQVAKDFKAQCTPDIYLFDKDKKLTYHGRIDDNWQDETKVIRHELKEAVDAMAAGSQVEKRQTPSMGCSIKWLKK
ncbi:MAG: thioredoxin family protein [Candidatus Aceula meridiana]|nr:thioredoxin family protein [Candidatus Aceula meridiana]